jgi:hypothetical protein
MCLDGIGTDPEFVRNVNGSGAATRKADDLTLSLGQRMNF